MSNITVDMSSKIETDGPEYHELVEKLRAYTRSLTFRERARLSLEISRRPGKFKHYGQLQLSLLANLLKDPDAPLSAEIRPD